MTTTPTKNESLPELGRPDLITQRGRTGYSQDRVLAYGRACYEAALTREAPTEGVGGVRREEGWCDGCPTHAELRRLLERERRITKQLVAEDDARFALEQTATPPAPQRMAQGEDKRESAFVAAAMSGTCDACGESWCEEDCPARLGTYKVRASLADRLRPNVEATPWVISVVRELERDYNRLLNTTPPAPQLQSSNPSGLSSESAPLSSEQRLVQGECRHSLWSPAGGYCLDCGYSPVGPDEESAIDAAVGLAKVVLRLPVDLLGEIDHRAQQSGCVRNAYLRQLLAEHHTQPPHQDRGEVNPARTAVLRARQNGRKTELARELLAREYDKEGCHGLAESIRAGQLTTHLDECSIRAITAALTEAKQQGPGEAVASDAEVDVAIARLFGTHRNDEEKREVASYARLIAEAYYRRHAGPQARAVDLAAFDALAQKWQDEAADSWGEDKDDAARQACCNELRALISSASGAAPQVDAQQRGESVTDRCPHGIRNPHPCRECEDSPLPEEAKRQTGGGE